MRYIIKEIKDSLPSFDFWKSESDYKEDIKDADIEYARKYSKDLIEMWNDTNEEKLYNKEDLLDAIYVGDITVRDIVKDDDNSLTPYEEFLYEKYKEKYGDDDEHLEEIKETEEEKVVEEKKIRDDEEVEEKSNSPKAKTITLNLKKLDDLTADVYWHLQEYFTSQHLDEITNYYNRMIKEEYPDLPEDDDLFIDEGWYLLEYGDNEALEEVLKYAFKKDPKLKAEYKSFINAMDKKYATQISYENEYEIDKKAWEIVRQVQKDTPIYY